MNRSNERQLIEAVQNGDKVAYGKLIRIHQKRLFRFIYGLLGSFDATEDIVQDSFVKAYNSIDKFNLEFAFYPWLATIAKNRAFNYMQREEKKESLDKVSEIGFNPIDPELGPLEQVIDSEGQKKFNEALQSMPMKYRSVFVLRHFERMDYAAIASYLKIPPGTVDSRIFRARQFLMDKLKDML